MAVVASRHIELLAEKRALGFKPVTGLGVIRLSTYLEPIREVLESDESDVIH